MEKNIQDRVGKWGCASFHFIDPFNDKGQVHPDDRELLISYPFTHSFHQCIGIDGDYLILQFGNIKIRVTPEHFKGGPRVPEFMPLTQVKYLNSKKRLEFGIIKGIHFHDNERRFYYSLEVNNTMKGRRYYAEDLKISHI